MNDRTRETLVPDAGPIRAAGQWPATTENLT